MRDSQPPLYIALALYTRGILCSVTAFQKLWSRHCERFLRSNLSAQPREIATAQANASVRTPRNDGHVKRLLKGLVCSVHPNALQKQKTRVRGLSRIPIHRTAAPLAARARQRLNCQDNLCSHKVEDVRGGHVSPDDVQSDNAELLPTAPVDCTWAMRYNFVGSSM